MFSSSNSQWDSDKHVAVIGAGFGGIVTALRLQKLGITNFTIYEKGSEVGGTWRDNAYPGCSVDVSAQYYSISSEPNPNWSERFAGQPELWQYQKDVVNRNNLRPHLRLNSKLVDAVWNESRHGYTLTIERMQPNPKTPFSGSTATPTGELETVFADVLIQAIGGAWTIPKIPTAKDFPGLDDFEGPIFHSAAWRSDIDLKGKRVGVVGNAATGCQIVSALSKDPDVKVVNFARTPQWFVERPQVQYPQIVKWAFEYIPYLQRTVRNWVHFQHDMLYIVVPDFASFLRPYGAGWYLNRMRRKAPKSLHAELAPDLAFGCRRVIRDPGYYESLGKPNVSLETSPIANVSPRGVQLENGKQVDVDVLVMATGFESSIQTVFPLTGRSGVSLKQEWEQQGGPAAYYGTAVPGFPNHFMLLGPNTAAGHSSFLFTEEVTADYVMEMIQPILKKGAKVASVEVKKDSYQGYNAWLQEKIGATVWSTCTSYYNNFGSKNFALYPGTLTQFWWHLRRPNWADWSLS